MKKRAWIAVGVILTAVPLLILLGEGRGLGTPDLTDTAVAIAVDGSGNVYVTGHSLGSGTDYDYATVKSNTNGQRLWVNRYNGPGNGYDGAVAIAVDGAGNVFISGESKGSGSDSDYATIKYDTNGQQLWAKRYNGTGNRADEGFALAVDGQSNVYVTGVSVGPAMGKDVVTIKYKTSGKQLWAQRYTDPYSGFAGARAIVVDGSGNAYVSGDRDGPEYTHECLTIKYDTNGKQLWARTYSGPDNHSEMARAAAIDGSGNVYITAWGKYNLAIDGDYATIKYGPGGKQLWVRWYDGPANHGDFPTAIAVDGSGNAYVTGWSIGPSLYSSNSATIKYSPGGEQLWVRRYDGTAKGNDFSYAVVLDGSGNVYITGYGSVSHANKDNYDYLTIKYSPNGKLLWAKTYNGPGNGLDIAMDIAVDGSGNVYITGQSKGSGNGSGFGTVKYDAKGKQIWVRMYKGPGN
jgi:outer membrane protein assembly factor BamB